ncbi:MAG: sugar ABC transporter permease [Rhodococcus sp.]|nr:sugar ABC transporter permease [Rhodococcus sp. (in: high G+C Gram-positive bacteria)]
MFVEVPSTGGSERAVAARPARSGWMPRTLVPYLYLLPAVVLLIVWIYKPLGETVNLSFYKWNMVPTTPKVAVGLDNYTRVLSLPELHQALRNTVVYTLAFMLFSLLLPIVIAMVSKRISGRSKTIYQALIFVPFLVTPIAGSAVWRWLFNPDGGAIPRVAATWGIEMGNIFRDPKFALLGVVVIVGWQMLGFGVLVISAGLAGINPDYASAASLDGASEATITRKITLPLLSPTLVFLALMTILLGAQ